MFPPKADGLAGLLCRVQRHRPTAEFPDRRCPEGRGGEGMGQNWGSGTGGGQAKQEKADKMHCLGWSSQSA